MKGQRWDKSLQTVHPGVAPADWLLDQCCRRGCRRWCSWVEGESLWEEEEEEEEGEEERREGAGEGREKKRREGEGGRGRDIYAIITQANAYTQHPCKQQTSIRPQRANPPSSIALFLVRLLARTRPRGEPKAKKFVTGNEKLTDCSSRSIMLIDVLEEERLQVALSNDRSFR